LGARYRIQKLLGEGGMGRAYLASDREQDRLVAMKFLHAGLGATLASMQEEVRLLASLSHPRLVKIFDYHAAADSLWEPDPERPLRDSERPSGPCFTMEFLPGRDLEHSSSDLSGDDWVSLLAQLCQGLHYLHAHNILHRDLKPSNVWWTESKEVKLLDFGLARVSLPADRREGPQGTLAYLAPEACFGPMESRSDLYSLGVLCYEGLSGRLPYAPWPLEPRQANPATPLASLRPDLPTFLCGLIDRLVEPDPVRRPASALSALRYLNQHVEKPFPILSGEITEAVLQKLPLFGRDPELGEFWGGVARVGRGKHPALIEIAGPTGSGRSRFLEENRCPLQLRGFRYVAIEASDRPWRDQVLQGLGELAENVDPLGLAELTFASARRQPLALSFQDLHAWGESELQELRLFLRLSFHGHNRLLLILERNSDLAPAGLDALLSLSREWPATCIALSDLDTEAAHGLVRSVPLAKPVPTAVAEGLVQGAGGRPWLLLELLRRYLSTGSGPEARGEREFAEEFREVVRLRVRELGPASQRLLALLVTHPLAFGVAELGDLWDGATEPWQVALLELDRRGFVRSHGLERSDLHLAQPSLREAYTQALPEPAISAAHQRWIHRLEKKLGKTAQPCSEAVALAEHAYQAGDRALAKPWGNVAAEFFEREGKVAEALAWYQRLLPWAETTKERYLLHGASAPLFYRLGRLDKALESYDAWFRERPDDETRLQKATHLFYTGLILFAMGCEAEARERFESCLKIGERGRVATHRPFHARSLAFLASMEEKANRADAAQHLLREALTIAAGNSFLLGDIEQRLGELEQAQLHLETAAEHFSASLLHFQAAGRPQAQAVALQFLAMLRNEAGDSVESLVLIERALVLSRDSGQLLQWARYEQNKALIHMDAGSYGAANEAMERAREILDVLGTEEDRRLAAIHRLDLAIRVGNWDQADRFLEKLETGPFKDRGLLAELLPCKAEWHYFRGDFPRAQQEFENFLEIARGKPKKISALSAELGLCRAKARQGVLSSQEPALRSALSTLEKLPAPIFSLWKTTLPLLAAKELEVRQQQDFEGLPAKIEAMGRHELSIDLYELLSLTLERHGLARSAQHCRAAAQAARLKIHQRLPEELQMDFEKNRRVDSWDQALSERIAPNPPSPPPTTRDTPAKVSEQRFRQYSEISRQISQRNDLAGILERVMDAAIELTGAERGFLLLRNEAAKKKPLAGFEVRTARHLNQQSLGQEDFQISMTAVKQAIDQGTTLLTGNAQLDPRLQEKKSVVQFQLKAILAIPLELEGKVIGAIYLDHRYHPSCFNEEDIVFLNAFAVQAALAIQKARLIEELNQAKDQLEEKVENQAQRIEVLSDELTKVSEQRSYGYEDIVGRSPAMMEVFNLLDNVIDTMIPVWIHGESGTGKELVARSLHFNSSRKAGPFVAQNCSAIPEALLESELFGHKKGAFTHADRDRSGLFEQASGGTLFLDEVADMSLSMQVKLLRVLQDSEVRPLGSNKSTKVDVRLVTASNKNLEKLVEEEKFRQDLFFRINGITIPLPPLRDRREDIPLLVNYLLKKISRDFKLKPSEVSDKAYQKLVDYPWPGNIRQLEAVLRNALLFAKGRTITPEFLSITKGPPTAGTSVKANAALPVGGERREERQLILESLRKNKMNKRLAAEDLGISLRSLYMRMARHGIPKSKPVLAKFLGLKD